MDYTVSSSDAHKIEAMNDDSYGKYVTLFNVE